jgi:hypothetical protein
MLKKFFTRCITLHVFSWSVKHTFFKKHTLGEDKRGEIILAVSHIFFLKKIISQEPFPCWNLTAGAEEIILAFDFVLLSCIIYIYLLWVMDYMVTYVNSHLERVNCPEKVGKEKNYVDILFCYSVTFPMKNGVAEDLWVIGGLSKATRFDFPVEIFKCMREKKKKNSADWSHWCASGGSGAG